MDSLVSLVTALVLIAVGVCAVAMIWFVASAIWGSIAKRDNNDG